MYTHSRDMELPAHTHIHVFFTLRFIISFFDSQHSPRDSSDTFFFDTYIFMYLQTENKREKMRLDHKYLNSSTLRGIEAATLRTRQTILP